MYAVLKNRGSIHPGKREIDSDSLSARSLPRKTVSPAVRDEEVGRAGCDFCRWQVGSDGGCANAAGLRGSSGQLWRSRAAAGAYGVMED